MIKLIGRALPQGGYIKEVRFYHDGKIWLTLPSHSMTHQTEELTYQYNNNVMEIATDDPVRAIKENLQRSDNYWMKHKPKYTLDEGCYLYLCCRPVQPVEVLTSEDETELQYGLAYSLPFSIVTESGYASGFWRIVRNNLRRVKTDFGKRCDDVSRDIKLSGIDCEVNMARLLKLFNVSRIEPATNHIHDGAEFQGYITPEQAERLIADRNTGIYRDPDRSTPVANWFIVSEQFKLRHGADWMTKLRELMGGKNA